MYCKKCGKQISDDSLFCKYCGSTVEENCGDEIVMQKVLPEKRCSICGTVFYGEGETCSTCARFNSPAYKIGESLPLKQNSNGKAIAVAVILFIAIISGIIVFGLLSENNPSARTQATDTSSYTDASIDAASALEAERKQMSIDVAYNAEKYIKKYLEYPDKCYVNHGSATMEYDDAYVVSKGRLKYTNAQDEDIKTTYEVGMYTDQKTVYAVYVKLGEKILLDDRDSVNPAGVVLSDDYQVGDKYFEKGSPLFENIFSFSKHFVGKISAAVSSDDGKISLDAYNQIQTGMSFDEVSKIVGSSGTVMSETDLAGYHTIIVMWYGHGTTGANANVTIQNDKVISKAQFGLN